MQPNVFHKLLLSAIQQGASDIHLQVAHPPLLRVDGELQEVKYHPLTPSETEAVAREILSNSNRPADLATFGETDVAYSLEGHGRFRASIFRQRGSVGVVLRIIPITIRSFSELALPRALEQIASLRRGLVVVAGAAGHGKTTALAAMVEHVNTTRRAHVVTIEDPIEFLFKHQRAVISQREVGSDTRSFAGAALAALRQDPDVIVIGELGDQATLEVALNAAETGRLVMASLHTTDVVRSVDRLLQFYPAGQEPALRSRLADNLAAVVALRLAPLKGRPGRVPVVEVLRSTATARECIQRPERTAELTLVMARERVDTGSQTFDQHLADLVADGRVEIRVARAMAADPDAFERACALSRDHRADT